MSTEITYHDIKNRVYVKCTERPDLVLRHLRLYFKDKIALGVSKFSQEVTEIGSYVIPQRNLFNFFVDGSVSFVDGQGKVTAWDKLNDVVWPIAPQSKYLNKIVRFKYNGGTNFGGTRIVKVTSENDGHFYGTDLEKGETRQYILSRISGPIEILN